ncbi:MAG: hypothetical protein ACRCUE_11850 [Bosea sp. (in: a-proteobacteria)]
MQRLGQLRHLPTIDVGQARMQQDRRIVRNMISLQGEGRLASFELGHLLLHRGVIHSVRDGSDDLRNLPVDPGRVLLDPGAVALAVVGKAIELRLGLADETLDQVGMQKLVLQPAQDPGFQLFLPEG